MGRIFVLLVVIASVSCSFDPFELPPLPKTIYIEDDFTPEEQELIIQKIDMINDELGILLGYNILIYGGLIDDPDGFNADGSDMGDDKHVIYRIDRSGEAYQTLSCIADREFGGYATLQDVLMVSNLDGVDELVVAIAAIEAIDGWEANEDLAREHTTLEGRRRTILWVFRKIVAHELGHHIGLSHNPNEDTLMYPDGRPYESIQPGDKEAFCFVRDCISSCVHPK